MTNQIVCFGLSPWQSGVPARTEQLLSRLAIHAQVLYFEPPHAGVGRKARKVRPNITAIALPAPLPIASMHPALFRNWQRRCAHFAAKVMEQLGFSSPLFWLTNPEWFPLIETMPRSGLVYDCTRDFSLLPEQWEQELAYVSDVCFAAAPSLAFHLQNFTSNVVLLPNGCNFPVFAGVLPRRNSRQKVLTYCGTLWEDLDLSPVLEAAQAHPEWRFHFAGAVQERFMGTRQAARYSNIEFLGPYESRDMANILNESDVCLNLLRSDHPIEDLIPNRIYEYLATGKPIVSMLYPEQIETFADSIYGASTAREFLHCCERALLETGDAMPERRRRRAQEAHWATRAEQIADILKSIGLYQF